MNKIILRITVLTFFILNFDATTEAKVNTEVIPQNQFPSLMEIAFLRSLGGTILEIMESNGDLQLFENERIEKISAGNGQYDVKLRVIGFEGAHSPPYKLIRMTIRIPDDKGNAEYRVLSYSHRPITNKEYEELTKFASYD